MSYYKNKVYETNKGVGLQMDTKIYQALSFQISAHFLSHATVAQSEK